MKYEIKYIEPKAGIAAFDAWIGKVTFSKSGKTTKYQDREFRSLKGNGYKSNCYDVETGDEYWISGCRTDGNDGLYPINVYVDEDIRHEYWEQIRKMPERREQATFQSIGKYGGKGSKKARQNV